MWLFVNESNISFWYNMKIKRLFVDIRLEYNVFE